MSIFAIRVLKVALLLGIGLNIEIVADTNKSPTFGSATVWIWTLVGLCSLLGLVWNKGRMHDPSVPYTDQFATPNHKLEVAFQMPSRFQTPEIKQQLRIAAKAALLDCPTDQFQECLERVLAKEARELGIAGFRVRLTEISSIPVDPPEATAQYTPPDRPTVIFHDVLNSIKASERIPEPQETHPLTDDVDLGEIEE